MHSLYAEISFLAHLPKWKIRSSDNAEHNTGKGAQEQQGYTKKDNNSALTI